MDEDFIETLKSKANERLGQRSRATIIGAGDNDPALTPDPQIEIDRLQQLARERINGPEAYQRIEAFRDAPELGVGVGLRDMLTPLPEDSSIVEKAGRAVRNTGLAVAGATTLDPWEYGQMLMKQDPNIGVIQTPEGEFFAVRSIKDADGKITGERIAAINNLGPSPKDALQALGVISAAAPANLPVTIGRRVAVAGGIQAGIQAEQALLGGEFNPLEVAVDTVAQGASDLIPVGWRAYKSRGTSDIPSSARETAREVTEAGKDNITQAYSSPRVVRAAESVQPDPELVGAAKRLDMLEGEGSVPVSAISGNEQYRAVEAGLTARVGSDLSVAEGNAIINLSEKAGETLQRYGRIPRSQVDDQIRGSMQGQIADLSEASDDLYKALDKAVERFGSKYQTVDTSILNSYSDSLMRSYRSVNEMPSGLRSVVSKITDPEGISYEGLDQLRRSVGEQYASALRGSNPFPDTDVRSLGQMYDVLTNQQNKALNSIVGNRGGQIWDSAKALIVQRKGLEQASVDLFGRDLMKDLMPSLETSLASIGRGNIRNFTQKMESIPIEMRPQVMINVLGAMMERGMKSANIDSAFGINKSFYSNWWRQVKGDPKVFNLVTKHLEPDQVQFFDDVARLGGSLQRNAQKKPMNGRIVEFVNSFDSEGGLMSRILLTGALAGLATTPLGPMAAVASGGTVSALTGFLGRGASKTSISQASDLIGSQPFKRLVLNRLDNKPTTRVAENLVESTEFVNWFGSLSSKAQEGIREMGRKIVPEADPLRILATGATEYFTRSNIDEFEQYITGEQ